MMEKIKTAKQLINEKLNAYPNRLAHSYGVANTARKLAMIHHVNPDFLEIAGLMHDYAKYDSLINQTKNIDEHIIKEFKDHPVIYHAYAAAYKIETVLDIHEEAILSAVRCHVWGKPDMTTMDKILFVADFCEPNRPFDDKDYIYDLASHQLDAAVYYCMQKSMEDLEQRGLKPSEASLKAYQYYKEVTSGSTT